MASARYVDLDKAFDTIVQSLILGKVEKYGFRAERIDILISYSNDR